MNQYIGKRFVSTGGNRLKIIAVSETHFIFRLDKKAKFACVAFEDLLDNSFWKLET